MALEQRVQSLKKRHAEIDALIRVEETRPSVDQAALHDLKRQKLVVKDQLESLMQEREAAA